MDNADDARLIRLLGDPELAWLVARVRRRLEHGRALEGTVTLGRASSSQREAVRVLLGRRPRSGQALSVSLPAVDALLRRSGACPGGLREAVVRLGGPVVVRVDVAATQAAAWEQAFEKIVAFVDVHRPELGAWLEALRVSGIVKRLEPDSTAAGVLLDRLAYVLRELPAKGEPIGRFAARAAGGAHSLDDGQPLATLTLGAARALAGIGARPLGDGESPAESRRETWAAVGVLRDELSSTVLCLGLPADSVTGSSRTLLSAREVGEPVVLTLRQLVRDPPRWRACVGGETVYVCENPVVVALAADRHGSGCAPLICTRGQPGAAVMVLLRGLSAAGARLVHHGDFDWGGLRIANVLHARLPIEHWRFDHVAYVRAAAHVAGPPLRGREASAAWDPELASAMRRFGRAVEEESVVDDLLDDLGR